MSNKKSISPKPRRPKAVTCLIIVTIFYTFLHLFRFYYSLLQWDFLIGQEIAVSPIYLTLSGAFWVLIGGILIWGLWRGSPWAPNLTRISILVYFTFFWIDRVFLTKDIFAQMNNPFAILLSLIVIMLIFWLLSRSKSRAFFGEIND